MPSPRYIYGNMAVNTGKRKLTFADDSSKTRKEVLSLQPSLLLWLGTLTVNFGTSFEQRLLTISSLLWNEDEQHSIFELVTRGRQLPSPHPHTHLCAAPSLPSCSISSWSDCPQKCSVSPSRDNLFYCKKRFSRRIEKLHSAFVFRQSQRKSPTQKFQL